MPALPALLDQIEGSVESMTGDGADDGHPEAAIIIPPRSTAVSSKTAAARRDKHLERIARQGRLGWIFPVEPR